jgi:peptidoglycan/LPS O-acetylase OafA/YrhL
MTVEQSGATIGPIQCLRGIAALMVVIHHLQNQLGRLGFEPTDWATLPSGVDIFFVISGFIMWVTTASKPERTAFVFYRDRVTRIAPLYWAITAAVVLILLAAPGAAETAILDWPHLVYSVLFIPAVHPVTHAYQPTLIPGWTLNLEMFFYLIFGAAMAAAGTKLKLRAWLILFALTAVVVVGQVSQPQGVWAFYLQDIVGEFAVGILIGIAYMERRLPRSSWFWMPVAAGFLILAVGGPLEAGDSRFLRWGIPASLIVFGSVFLPHSGPPILQRLGDWSYSLYLSHPLTLSASEKLWGKAGGVFPLEIFPVFAVAAAILLSGLIHRIAEVPMTRWARRLTQLSLRRNSSAPA